MADHALGRHARRYAEIAQALADGALSDLRDRLGLSRRTRRGKRAPGEDETLDRPPRLEGSEQRIRETIERLGPTFIKAGQILSERPDLVPAPLLTELKKLQDDVPPIPYAAIAQVVEAELGAPPDQVFVTFDEKPIAAASIGQVHAATMRREDGSIVDVVVKVQRPGVDDTMRTDVEILREHSRFLQEHTSWGRQLRLAGIADELGSALLSELDYTSEGRTCDTIREEFSDDPMIVVPRVWWDHTTRRVLVLDHIKGIQFNHADEFEAAGLDKAELMRRTMNAYFHMVLDVGTYHADPHAGNLVAMPGNAVAFLDFGRAGRLGPILRRRLAELLLAFVQGDHRDLADIILDVTAAGPEVDGAALERGIERYMDRYRDVELGGAGIASGLLSDLFDIVRESEISLPSEFAVPMQVISELEGLMLGIDPTFDFAAVARPYALRLARREMRPNNLLREALGIARDLRRLARAMPDSAMRALKRAAEGEFKVAIDPSGLEGLTQRVESIGNRLALALIISGFVVGLGPVAAQLSLPRWVQIPILVMLMGALGVGLWFFGTAILRGRRGRGR
jgi:ubiquinone biosynthesis protein